MNRRFFRRPLGPPTGGQISRLANLEHMFDGADLRPSSIGGRGHICGLVREKGGRTAMGWGHLLC